MSSESSHGVICESKIAPCGFAALSRELRDLIYEQYLIDDKTSIITENWSGSENVDWVLIYPPIQYPRGVSRGPDVFLPGLCLVNRAFGREVVSLLLASAQLKIGGSADCRYVVQIIDACSQLQIASSIRRLVLHGINDIRLESMPERGCSADVVLESYRIHSQLLSRCPNIKALELHFFNHFESEHEGSSQKRVISSNEARGGMNVESILQMDNLESLELWGSMLTVHAEATGKAKDAKFNIDKLDTLLHCLKDGFERKDQHFSIWIYRDWPERTENIVL